MHLYRKGPNLVGCQCAGLDPSAAFAPFPLRDIACVSILIVERYDWQTRRFGMETLSRQRHSERAILSELEQIVASADEVITFNGRGFDVPVLLARAAVTEQAVPSIARLYRREHVGLHADLLDEVTGSRSAPRPQLAQICAALAIPVKLGIDGGEVEELASWGEWQRIVEYCETDVVATWFAAQMWRGTRIEGLGRERWQELSEWILSEQPRLTHLLPYTLLPGYPLGGRRLSDSPVAL